MSRINGDINSFKINLSKFLENDVSKNNLKENYKKILTVFSPILPHIIFECLESLDCEVFQVWPDIDKKLLEVENIEFVIQINGKKRGLVTLPKNSSEDDLLKLIMTDDKISKYIEGKDIKKKIYIKDKRLNVII